MANSLELGSRLSDYSIEKNMEAIKYDDKKFVELFSEELMSAKGYNLIKGEIFGKPNLSGEKLTQDKINAYLEGLGGDIFGKDIFEKGKKLLLKDAKEANADPEAYWKKYAKTYDENENKKNGNKKRLMTAKKDNKIAEFLFSKELSKLSEVPLKDAIAAGIFPKFGMEDIVFKAMLIWETQEKGLRMKALKKSAAKSGAISRRTTLQSQVKVYTVIGKKTEYDLGSAEMPAEIAGTTPKLNKSLKNRAIGVVSTQAYDAKLERSETEWRTKWQSLAKQYATLYSRGRLYNEFPTETQESDKVLGVIDALVRLNAKGGMKDESSTFDSTQFKQDLEERFGTEIIYGTHGVFNMLLALGRANIEMALQEKAARAEIKDPKELAAALKELREKTLYDLQVGKGKTKKHRFSRLDTTALSDGEVKDLEPVKAPKEEPKPAEAKEDPTDPLNQFSVEMKGALVDISTRSGVKVTQEGGKEKHADIRFVDFYGEYRGEKKKMLRAVLINGKITLPKGKAYSKPKDAAYQVALDLFDLAIQAKAELGEQSESKDREKKWYANFDKFIGDNNVNFLRQKINITKNKAYIASATIDSSYEIKVDGTTFYTVPDTARGKIALWAKVVTKEETALKHVDAIDVNFENPDQFVTDLEDAKRKVKVMEKYPPSQLKEIPKKAPVGTAEVTPKSSEIVLNSERPQDMKAAVKELQQIQVLFKNAGNKVSEVDQVMNLFTLQVGLKDYTVGVRTNASKKIEFFMGAPGRSIITENQKIMVQALGTIVPYQSTKPAPEKSLAEKMAPTKQGPKPAPGVPVVQPPEAQKVQAPAEGKPTQPIAPDKLSREAISKLKEKEIYSVVRSKLFDDKQNPSDSMREWIIRLAANIKSYLKETNKIVVATVHYNGAGDNQIDSEKAALNMKKILLSEGIPADKLIVLGVGAQVPDSKPGLEALGPHRVELRLLNQEEVKQLKVTSAPEKAKVQPVQAPQAPAPAVGLEGVPKQKLEVDMNGEPTTVAAKKVEQPKKPEKQAPLPELTEEQKDRMKTNRKFILDLRRELSEKYKAHASAIDWVVKEGKRGIFLDALDKLNPEVSIAYLDTATRHAELAVETPDGIFKFTGENRYVEAKKEFEKHLNIFLSKPKPAPAKAVGAPKSLTEGLSIEDPKDPETAMKQLTEIYNRLKDKWPEEVWGLAGNGFNISLKTPTGVITRSISAEAGDKYASDPISKKPHFTIRQGKTENIYLNQQQLMVYIEKKLLVQK